MSSATLANILFAASTSLGVIGLLYVRTGHDNLGIGVLIAACVVCAAGMAVSTSKRTWRF